MKIHEYQAKAILSKYGVAVPRGEMVTTREGAEAAAKKLMSSGANGVVVKAQIHAGGRGKGGGVKIAKTVEEAVQLAGKILGMQLVTHQTGPEGMKVQRLLIEETLPIARELYLGIVLDRTVSRPVFMASAAGGMEIEEVAAKVREQPLYDFTAPDGIRHTAWRIAGGAEWVKAFGHVARFYIADGHHRAASAARVAHLRRERNPQHTGAEDYNWFLCVVFPASELNILPYNRVIPDLNGRDQADFLEQVRAVFGLENDVPPAPDGTGRVSMYLGGKWYGLRCPADPGADPVSRLDVSVLQNRLLAPILGIDDPRTSKRIDFVGGIRGAGELVRRVDARGGVAFSLFPVTVAQLMEIADAGQIMPPKSTWFEPKLRSGLFIHTF